MATLTVKPKYKIVPESILKMKYEGRQIGMTSPSCIYSCISCKELKKSCCSYVVR